jgi:hypothetical protein
VPQLAAVAHAGGLTRNPAKGYARGVSRVPHAQALPPPPPLDRLS